MVALIVTVVAIVWGWVAIVWNWSVVAIVVVMEKVLPWFVAPLSVVMILWGKCYFHYDLCNLIGSLIRKFDNYYPF